MHDKYGANRDPYCYPETDVLINLLDIKNQEELSEAESAFSAERYRTYQARELSLEQFNLEHLQELNHHLFQDLFSWAGEIRTIDISKGSTRFCTCNRIHTESSKLLANIPKLSTIDETSDLLESIAELFCELNLIHPFREGNGRTQRFFFEELLFVLGYEVTWPQISKEEWIEANVAGINLNLKPLKKILNQAISKQNKD